MLIPMETTSSVMMNAKPSDRRTPIVMRFRDGMETSSERGARRTCALGHTRRFSRNRHGAKAS